MEVWVVWNTTASTNVFAGLYDNVTQAMQAVKDTYAKLRNGATVTFTPAFIGNSNVASTIQTKNGQVTYTASNGDTGTITPRITANGPATLEGF